MIKGLTSHKVRQSPPRKPSRPCSPRKYRGEAKPRGPKASPLTQPTVIQSSFLGITRESFPHITNAVWNSLVSVFRENFGSLLKVLDAASRHSDVDVLGVLESDIPRSVYQLGCQLSESFLMEHTGHQGNTICCSSCDKRTLRFKEYRTIKVKSLLGDIEIKRARYCCHSCQFNLYPLDWKLGINDGHKVLPKLREAMAKMSSKTSYADAQETLHSILPARFCLRTHESITRVVGTAALMEREQERQDAFEKPKEARFPKPIVSSPLTDVAVVAADGGFCRMKDKAEPYREFKMGVLGWLHKKPRTKSEDSPPKVTAKRYVGSFLGADRLMELAQIEYHRMGLDKAAIVQFLGDGADWIWNRAPAFQGANQEIVYTLDIYHAREYIHDTASSFYGQSSPKAKEWYQQRNTELLAGEFRKFFLAFTNLAKQAKARGAPELEELVQKNRNYFDQRRQLLNYKQCLERGLLIGSGMVEGGIRFVAKDRLHRAGMQWTEPGAEEILCLRALQASKKWEGFIRRQTEARKRAERELCSKLRPAV